MPVLTDLVALVAALLKTLAPDELVRIKKELEALEEEHAKQNAEVQQALAAGDLDTLNRLLCVYKDQTTATLPFSSPPGRSV